MAVPFHLPEDQNEVEVLVVQLQTLLSRLQVAVCRSQQLSQQQQQQQQQPSSSSNSLLLHFSRARHFLGLGHSSSSTTRPRNDESLTLEPSARTAQNALPDLLMNLSSLTDNGASGSPSPLTDTLLRSPRRRTTSESSSPDETKISITAIVKQAVAQDWNKLDCVDVEEIDPMETDGIFSKLMPASVSSCSLMTAMICFVGWHIFRGR
ncbi:uncharacterized protein [Euwallacea fornicatus]|uniref:uncharacterized protein n=1 Tax=Euwallacea fornicatus TaxID=995702 RepID=UPI00338F922B